MLWMAMDCNCIIIDDGLWRFFSFSFGTWRWTASLICVWEWVNSRWSVETAVVGALVAWLANDVDEWKDDLSFPCTKGETCWLGREGEGRGRGLLGVIEDTHKFRS